MEPIKLEFIVKGDIDKELSRINLAIKGVGDQSYSTFSRLLQDSNKSFTGLSAGTQSFATTIQDVIGCLRANEQAQQALYVEYEKGAMSAAGYAEAQARLSVQNTTLKNQASELARQVESEIRQNSLVAGSLQERIITLSRLREEYARLGKVERESMVGTSLVTQIQQVDEEIMRMQANMGRVKIGANGFNSLGMSVQQVARELPALTMGANMFFLAISNNLPILVDNLKQARAEFNNLKAANQAAVPVWKQVLSSIISWQTALVVGITLLSVYGKDIINWTKGLFGVKKVLDANLDSLDGFQKKVSESSGKTIATYKKMSTEWKALGNDLNAKKRYITENASAFDQLNLSITNTAEADALFTRQGDAFIESLILRAKAAAAMDIASEKYQEALKKMMEADSLQNKANETRKNQDVGIGGYIQDTRYGVQSRNQLSEQNAKSIEYEVNKLKAKSKELFTFGDTLLKKGAEYSKKETEILSESSLQSTKRIVANSVAAIEASIAQKKEALKKLTNKDDYAAAMIEIKKEIAALKGITGGTDNENNKIIDAQKKLKEITLENELKLQAGRIAILKEGKAKRLALADQEYKETLATIDKEKAEYLKTIKASKGKKDPAIIKTFDDRETAAKARETADITRIDKKYAEEYKQRTKTLTDVFLNEEERKLSAIKARYAEERKWADQQLKTGGMTKEEHKSYTTTIDKAQQQETYRSLLDSLDDYKQKEKDLREKWDTNIAAAVESKDAYLVARLMEGKRKALSSLNGQMLQESNEWKRLFGNLDNLTVEQLEKLSDTIKKKAKDLNLNPIDLKAVTDNLKEVDSQIRSKNPFEALSKHLKEYQTAEDETTKKKSLKEAFRDTAASIDMVKESFDAVVGGLNEMGLAGDEATQQLLGDISNLMGSASQLATSIASANPVGIIQGSIGVLTSVFNIFNNDKRHEKKIQLLKDQIDTLERSYDKLDRAMEKTYSRDAAKVIDRQNDNLTKQNELLQQQIKEEDAKKKTDKGKIKDWQNTIEDNNRQIEENKGKAVDAIFGSDIQSAIDDFATAYADAWAAGEDRATAMKGVVKNMIRGVIMEMLKLDLKPTVEAIRNKINAAMVDSIITDAEQAEIDALVESAVSDADKKYAPLDKYLKDDKDPSRTSEAKGIASISQESADMLNGQFNTQLIYLDKTLVQATGIREQMQFIYNLQVEGWKDVRAIRELSGKVSENTAKVAEISERIEGLSSEIAGNTKSTARGIQDMNDKGITLRR